MGLKETMAAIAAKPKDQLTYTDVADTYVYYIRVDFDPVGIKFCADEAEISKYKINAKAKAKLTYCQHLHRHSHCRGLAAPDAARDRRWVVRYLGHGGCGAASASQSESLPAPGGRLRPLRGGGHHPLRRRSLHRPARGDGTGSGRPHARCWPLAGSGRSGRVAGRSSLSAVRARGRTEAR